MSTSRWQQRACLIPVACIALGGLLLPLVSPQLPTPAPRTGAIVELQGVALPYNGPGTVWVLDSGSVMVQVGEFVPPPRSTDRTGGAVAGAPESDVQFIALRIADPDPVLVRERSDWRLQATRPPTQNANGHTLQVVSVTPEQGDDCARRSLAEAHGALHLSVGGRGVFTLTAYDARGGSLGFDFVEAPSAAVEQGGDTAAPVKKVTYTCSATCEKGSCSASVSCDDPPGDCVADCWCDEAGNAHCVTTGQPTNIVLPVALE